MIAEESSGNLFINAAKTRSSMYSAVQFDIDLYYITKKLMHPILST